MAEKALGLIEVRGFLGAVVVADAALKAANVSLLNVETVKSGLNTVQLVGDVSAVRSAVEAAVEIAQDQPYYLHSHVIARLDSQTDSILLPIQKEVNKDVSKAETSSSLEESVLEVIDLIDVPEVNPQPLISDNETAFVEDIISDIIVEEEVLTEGQQKYSEEELNKFKVVELRSIAYREDKIDLSKKEIKFANKQLLIQALLKLKS
ncbi:BMC domain-containing protein [Streptococcus parasanguinis]|jgi:ethanolamine utilization protein, putative|uniref:BMC domain-containing protein n=1 Tax=Streptococcus parasanguinis TaxID=1318 RepID=UPI0012BBDD86|nr:BMC domain-containing protein [Streptococcus parasanguinis]MBT0924505.1 BMC domain-containing protein [Streptococcus parasanguinis]MDU2419680.1 BMC domain-containing protein [Streptococcus parasanguinis]MTS06259.1 BMC domain-containing protein [Streptococcus parasanguinis]